MEKIHAKYIELCFQLDCTDHFIKNGRMVAAIDKLPDLEKLLFEFCVLKITNENQEAFNNLVKKARGLWKPIRRQITQWRLNRSQFGSYSSPSVSQIEPVCNLGSGQIKEEKVVSVPTSQLPEPQSPSLQLVPPVVQCPIPELLPPTSNKLAVDIEPPPLLPPLSTDNKCISVCHDNVQANVDLISLPLTAEIAAVRPPPSLPLPSMPMHDQCIVGIFSVNQKKIPSLQSRMPSHAAPKEKAVSDIAPVCEGNHLLLPSSACKQVMLKKTSKQLAASPHLNDSVMMMVAPILNLRRLFFSSVLRASLMSWMLLLIQWLDPPELGGQPPPTVRW